MNLCYLICSYCPYDVDCQHKRDYCERHLTIRELLEKELDKLTLQFHKYYTEVENDEEN